MSVRLCIHAYMADSFITFFSYSFGSSFFYHCIYGYMLCTFLLNFGNYVFLLCLCIVIALRILIVMLCSVLGILFHCVVLCIVCVQICAVLLPPVVNPIAVNKIYLILFYNIRLRSEA